MPKAFTVGEVLAVLRTRLELTREEGLVLFAQDKYMLRPNTKLEDVYDRYKDEDGFLYLVYAEENIYGWDFSANEDGQSSTIKKSSNLLDEIIILDDQQYVLWSLYSYS